MVKKRALNLFVDSALLKNYKKYIKSKGLIISRQFEIMIETQLKEMKNGRKD